MVGQKPAKNLDATSNFMKWVDNIVPNTFHLRGGEAGVRDQVESDVSFTELFNDNIRKILLIDFPLPSTICPTIH